MVLSCSPITPYRNLAACCAGRTSLSPGVCAGDAAGGQIIACPSQTAVPKLGPGGLW